MFTGSNYRAIQGSQLLDHAGQTQVHWEGWGANAGGSKTLGETGWVRGDSPSPHLLCPLLILAVCYLPEPLPPPPGAWTA